MAVVTLKAVFKAATAGFDAGVKRVNKGLETARKKTKETNKGMGSLGATMGKLAGGLGLSIGLGILAQKFFATNLEVEKLKASLVTITGSVQAAEGAFDTLMETASTTPFTLQQVTDSFIKLKSQGLKPTQDAMKDYGNIAAAMGKSLSQVSEGILDAVQGEWERMKEFGFKAKQEGDRIKIRFGGVTKEIGNNAAEIQAYLRGISKEKFGDAMQRQMGTMSGAISNLGDNITILFVALGEAGINEFIGDMILGISDLIKSMAGWETAIEAVGGAFATLIPMIGGGVAGLIAFKVVTMVSTAGVWTLVASLIAMKGALIATGIGALVVGIGMLLPMLYNWITASSRQAEESKKQADAAKKLRAETAQLAAEAKIQAAATERQIKLDKALAQRKKDITESGIVAHYKRLTDEIDKHNEASEAMEAMTAAGINTADHLIPLLLKEWRARGQIVHVLSEEAQALQELQRAAKAAADAAHAASAAGIAEGFDAIHTEVSEYKTAMEGLSTKIKAGIALTDLESDAMETLRGEMSAGAQALLAYIEAQGENNKETETAVGWLNKEIAVIENMEENVRALNEMQNQGIDITKYLTEAQIAQIAAGEELNVVLTEKQIRLKAVSDALEETRKKTEEVAETWKTKWIEAWKDVKQTFAGIMAYGVTRVLGSMVDILTQANRKWSEMGKILKDLGRQLLAMALNAMIMKLLSMLGGRIMGGGAGFLGGIGRMIGFGKENAQGGIISEPTALIGMRTGKTGTMSERGAEYIVPMHKMGRMAGAGGGGINVTINVHGSVGVDNIASEIVGTLRRHGLS